MPLGLWSALVVVLTLLLSACATKSEVEASDMSNVVSEPEAAGTSMEGAGQIAPEGSDASAEALSVATEAGADSSIESDSAGEPAAVVPKRPQAGGDVVWIQQRLKDLGYYSGPVDGDAGGATRQAIKDYQSDQGLTVTGRPTSELQDFMWRNDG